MKQFNSPVNVFYDEDEMLWYTKIGLISEGSFANVNGSFPLYYTVWGKSKMECKDRARQLTAILHYSQTINEAKLV